MAYPPRIRIFLVYSSGIYATHFVIVQRTHVSVVSHKSNRKQFQEQRLTETIFFSNLTDKTITDEKVSKSTVTCMRQQEQSAPWRTPGRIVLQVTASYHVYAQRKPRDLQRSNLFPCLLVCLFVGSNKRKQKRFQVPRSAGLQLENLIYFVAKKRRKRKKSCYAVSRQAITRFITTSRDGSNSPCGS